MPKKSEEVEEVAGQPQEELELSKKKKKKKKPKAEEAEEAPAETEEQPAEEPAEELELTKKKKKKKKAVQNDEEGEAPVEEEPAETEEQPAEEDVDAVIEELKKKKKKKSKKDGEVEEPVAGTYWNSTTTGKEGGEEEPEYVIKRDGDFGPEFWTKSDRDYKYAELLDRIFAMLKKKNPELGSGRKKRIKMKPPQVAKDGPKRTIFINFEEICTNLHRQPEHVLQYLFSELGTTGSVDGSNRLVIRGVFQGKNIESVLRKYISEYVICSVCGNLETILTRDPNTRLFSLNCMSCNASRTVQAVKQGFVANFTPRRNR